ncbi:MAG: hypothetical protein K1Y01_13540 [Vicinamibacteria bacterium]|nr:hypothetical protein [Vicinamibacteria bacterium]
MLETLAMALLALWVIGLITGNSLAGAIHVLLLAGLAVFYFHRREVARLRSMALMASSRTMANAMGAAAPSRKPAASSKSGPAGASRPSAAA